VAPLLIECVGTNTLYGIAGFCFCTADREIMITRKRFVPGTSVDCRTNLQFSLHCRN
jgi:hypothetical protein